MRTKKKLKILWGVLFLIILSVIVYAAIESVGGVVNKSGTVLITTRKNDLNAIDVAHQTDKAKPKPDESVQTKFAALIDQIDIANNERAKDKKVNDTTSKKATNIAEEIKSFYIVKGKRAKEKKYMNAAKFYEYFGDSVVIIAEVYTKDSISPKNVKKVDKRTKKEKKLIGAAYNEIDPSSLSPAQKKYLRDETLKNLKNDLSVVTGVIADLKLVIDDLKNSSKSGGLLSMTKKLAGGAGELNLAKSMMNFLKNLLESIKSSIQNILRLTKT